MFNFRTMAIIKREIKEQIMSKAFIIATLIIPLMIIGFVTVQMFLITYDDKVHSHIKIFSNNELFNQSLKDEFIKLNPDDNKSLLTTSILTYSKMHFADSLEQNKQALLDEKLSAIVLLDDSALLKKEFSYYAKNPKNFELINKIKSTMNKIMIDDYFSARDLTENDLQYIRKSMTAQTLKISEKSTAKEDSYGNLILAAAFSFLLYLSLLIMGMGTLRSVTEEKINRVVEVVLSSVSAEELMTGKIIGAAITGFLQIFIWIMPIAITGIIGMAFLPDWAQFEFNLFTIIYFLINYVLGIVTYLSLFASFGAIFDNDQDAQQGIMPLMFLIMIPFYIVVFTMPRNPANSIAEISSMIPFLSIIVMPARIATVDVPIWQIIISVILNIATLLFSLRMSAKIYRVGILITGKKPSWKEVFRWLKSA